MTDEPSFARLVSLACHDLGTPIATIHGFARTIPRVAARGQPTHRYVELIASASSDAAEVVDQLSLAARIESGRFSPIREQADTAELARAAARAVEGRARPHGDGGSVLVDRERATQALVAFVRCALGHGGVESVVLHASGAEVVLEPVAERVGAIMAGEDLRDLRAAVAVRVVRALGGSTAAGEGRFVVRLGPASSAQ